MASPLPKTKGQAFLIVRLGDPFAALDQIALHVADQGHRTPKAQRAQAQEIAYQLPERIRGEFLTGRDTICLPNGLLRAHLSFSPSRSGCFIQVHNKSCFYL